mmetsp:Transcript_5317/g.18097  ORF Transcript_5317/g.18097 Transcript_5317/m.18097 type:complete len:406 (+) Transcript_5317:2262-3479(+)
MCSRWSSANNSSARFSFIFFLSALSAVFETAEEMSRNESRKLFFPIFVSNKWSCSLTEVKRLISFAACSLRFARELYNANCLFVSRSLRVTAFLSSRNLVSYCASSAECGTSSNRLDKMAFFLLRFASSLTRLSRFSFSFAYCADVSAILASSPVCSRSSSMDVTFAFKTFNSFLHVLRNNASSFFSEALRLAMFANASTSCFCAGSVTLFSSSTLFAITVSFSFLAFSYASFARFVSNSASSISSLFESNLRFSASSRLATARVERSMRSIFPAAPDNPAKDVDAPPPLPPSEVSKSSPNAFIAFAISHPFIFTNNSATEFEDTLLAFSSFSSFFTKYSESIRFNLASSRWASSSSLNTASSSSAVIVVEPPSFSSPLFFAAALAIIDDPPPRASYNLLFPFTR